MTWLEERQFTAACSNVRSAIEKAIAPRNGLPGGYIPYYGEPDVMLTYYVNYAVRLARKFKLYPETAELEREAQAQARRAA